MNEMKQFAKTRDPNQQVGLWSTSYKWDLTFYDRIGDIIEKQEIYIPITDIDEYVKENYGLDLILTDRSDEKETIEFKIYILKDNDYYLYRRILVKIDFRKQIPNLG